METIGWENNSWKYLSLIGDERVVNLQRTKVYVFSDSVLCLGKIHETPQSNGAWEDRLGWFKTYQEYRDLDRIDGEPMEFEWNIFPGFNTLRLSEEVKSLLYRLGETPEIFTGRILCQCSMTYPVTEKATKMNAWQMPESSKYLQRDLVLDNGHSSVLVLRKSGLLPKKTVHKENGTIWRKGCCWNSLKADVQFSVLQLHCPEVGSKFHCVKQSVTLF